MEMDEYGLVVVGAGAAGMMAAISAAENGMPGSRILVVERNEKPGKKLYITGKGRCNLTNACDTEELLRNVPRNAKFLYSAFYTFDAWQAISFFEEAGMRTVVERGNRVFPASGHASDVIAALRRVMDRHGIRVKLHSKAEKLLIRDGAVRGVSLEGGREYSAARVAIACGGRSYPSTGSDGSGYGLARMAGHTITRLRPSLVPFTTAEEDLRPLQGLAPKNVRVRITRPADCGKAIYEGFGEMLFTHFGVSGPLMLTASSLVGDEIADGPLDLYIDWKPALDGGQLDRRILRDFEENRGRQFKNALGGLVPSGLIPVIAARSGIPEHARVSGISRESRSRLLKLLKAFHVTLTGLRGYNEAVVTRGGVSLGEVDPSTMESRLCRGLYFAGEILDLDALTGGFNLQIAWSTGYLAGLSAAMRDQSGREK